MRNIKIPNNLKLTSTSFDNVYLIDEQIHSDERGYFMETWNEMKYSNRKLLQNAPSLQSIKNDDSLFNTLFVQDNLSVSYKGVFRGLHYQCGEWGQAKLVRVIKGSIVDFIVDLREDSQTYGKFEYFELNEHNKKSLFIPPYFAHGFLCLEDNTIFTYKCGNYYNSEYEASISIFDPIMRHIIHKRDSIMDIIQMFYPYDTEDEIILSDKDKNSSKFLYRRI